MKCPGCNQAMRPELYEGVSIDHCHQCGGTWLDHGEVEKVAHNHSTSFDDDIKMKAIEQKGTDHRSKQRVACPKCNNTMQTHQYLFNSGVYIDQCPNKHGFYFDNGELEKLQIVVEEALLQRGMHSSQKVTKKTNGEKLCPRHHIKLETLVYESEHIDCCRKCGGVWLDDNELGKLTVSRLESFKATDHQDIAADESTTKVSPEIDLFVSLNCASCRMPMTRFNYGYNSGVVIDKCVHGHGIWLDAQELDRIQIFIERWEGASSVVKQKYAGVLAAARKTAESSFDTAVETGKKRGIQNSSIGRFLHRIK
jgi:Zn-finger nucleic acid-binding protein